MCANQTGSIKPMTIRIAWRNESIPIEMTQNTQAWLTLHSISIAMCSRVDVWWREGKKMSKRSIFRLTYSGWVTLCHWPQPWRFFFFFFLHFSAAQRAGGSLGGRCHEQDGLHFFFLKVMMLPLLLGQHWDPTLCLSQPWCKTTTRWVGKSEWGLRWVWSILDPTQTPCVSNNNSKSPQVGMTGFWYVFICQTKWQVSKCGSTNSIGALFCPHENYFWRHGPKNEKKNSPPPQ